MYKKFNEQFPNPLRHVVLPVVHVLNLAQAIRNVGVAMDAGADGVFLIGHSMSATELADIYKSVVVAYHGFWIGVNFLDLDLEEALSRGLPLWDDTWAPDMPRTNLYFGGVAFKYQAHVRDEDLAAVTQEAAKHMDVVVTSGDGTGHAPNVKKIEAMWSALRESDIPLAIASGITTRNVVDYLPYCRCLMVATGISQTFNELDPELTKSLVGIVRAYDVKARDLGPVTRTIQFLGTVEDEHFMDVRYCKRCNDFDFKTGDPVSFTRDLLDMCVYTSGCSGHSIRMFQIILTPFPESDGDKVKRRSDLLERWG